MEFEFFANGVNSSELSALSEEQSALMEARICELGEMADDAARFSLDIMSEDMSVYDAFAIISAGISFGETEIHSEALADNAARLSSYLKVLSLYDKAIFSQLYTDRLAKVGHAIDESHFLPIGTPKESFVYLKNSYADEAYDVFSESFDDPRVRYVASLKDAVSAVLDGEAGYCLLPLEERGARLPTIEEMLYRADLKIASVTPVFGFDGTLDMKYALVAKWLTPPQYSPSDDRYLEIRLPSDSDTTLSELLSVADSYGIGVYRINTASYQTESGIRSSYSIVFKSEGERFTTLLIYLTLFVNDYTPVGIYKNLE